MRYAPYERYVPSESVWLDQLPSHWQQLRVKHVIERMESGVSVNSDASPATSDEIGVLKTSCVYGDQFSPQENKRVLEDEVERVACHVKADRLIISRMNTPELVGSCGYVGQDFPNLYLPDRLWQTVFSKSRECLPRFAWYYLTSRPAKSAISSLAAGTSGSMQNIAQDAFVGIGFPLPPLDEQQTIARFLDAKTAQIDALVVQKRQLIAKLKEKRSALIARTVTRGLPPEAAKAAGLEPNPEMKDSGVDWLGEIPGHWDIEKFSREVHIAEGQVDPEVEPFASMVLIAPNHIESGTGRLFALETAAEQFAESGKYLCPADAVVYSKIRPALRKVAIAPEQCLCSADMYPLTCKKKLLNPYLYWLMLSDQFSAWSVLEADRVAMPKINRETLNELRLPIPPQKEQLKIVEYLTTETAKVDNLLAKAEEVINRLTEYRQALITSAVTGKIDVRGFDQRTEQ